MNEMKFINWYWCSACKNEWSMNWSCQCDDKCEKCGRSYLPYESIDIETEDNSNPDML